MLPAPSSGSHEGTGTGRPRGAQLSRIRFRRAVTLMLMTLVLPGSAQIAVGNKRTGRIAMRVLFSLVATVVLLAQPRPFVPVTKDMLLNPSPNDWLMYNRTYD
jgi:hypothetical protein